MRIHFSKQSNIQPDAVGNHPKDVIIESLATIPNYEYIVMPLTKNISNETILEEKYFFCFKCRKWLKASGTFGNIKSHLRGVHHEMISQSSIKELSPIQKALHAKRFILLNGLPFSLIESPDIQALAPEAGSRKKISIQCTSVAEDVRREIKNRYINGTNGHWLIIDEWTDKTMQKFLGVHASILTNTCDYECVCLAHQPLSEIHCDTPYISGVINEICNVLLPASKTLGIVSDTTNLMPAIASCLKVEWAPCYCHVMNLLLQDFVDACTPKLQCMLQIQRSLGSSQVFHNYLVQQNAKITSLPSYTITRWYSLFKLMKNFLALKNEIQSYLQSNRSNAIGVPKDEYFQIIGELIKVFGTARNVMGNMESDNFGSLSCVIDSFRLLNLSVYRLPEYFNPEKQRFNESFVQRWTNGLGLKEKETLLVAAWLNPFQMINSSLTYEERVKADNIIKRMINENSNSLNQPSDIPQMQQVEDTQYGYTYSAFANQNQGQVPENVRYAKLINQMELSSAQKSENILYAFWKANRGLYPSLFHIAMKTFLRPASSAMAERAFSKAKKALGLHRSSIKSSKFADSMMIIANPNIASSMIQ